MSYIIYGGKVIAETSEHCKSGECKFAYQKCVNAIDANRDFTLVNAIQGRISNAKKYSKMSDDDMDRILSVRVVQLRNDTPGAMPEFIIEN